VPRSPFIVSEVTPELESAFTELWMQARVEAGATEEWAMRSSTGERVSEALRRPDVRLYLARSGERFVGYVVLTQSPLSGLSETPTVWIDQVYVVPSARRGGVAKALLATATRYADEIGADQVASCVPAEQKESNRFYARLGFSQYVVRRVTTTANLRRRLTGAQNDASVQTVHLRRSLRARAARSSARFAR
jgi:GNAT superfamily N-acetyltransferase